MEKTLKSEKQDLVKIDAGLITQILKPYRQHSTYLQEAFFLKDEEKGPIARGEFAISDSCYIDDTGHFNAVEYNICYNQLAYVHLGYCINHGLIPELEGFVGGAFFEKQLSHFLIASLKSSYRSQINAKHFYGEFGINMIAKKSKCTFINTYCNFHDDDNGKSSGEVTLAVLHP